MSKYKPFVDYLIQLEPGIVTLHFAEIEEILGFQLPNSAYKYPAWWANSPSSKNNTHPWATLWVEAGWRSKDLDLETQQITFEHVGPLFSLNAKEAVEGYLTDRKILASLRNAALAKQRKERDNFTCQACGFHLRYGEQYIIEVHHLNPLTLSGQTITSIDDLISLCPTCHRIAHLRKVPLEIHEIIELRQK